MSDGAAFVLVMSESMAKELNLEPIARLVSYSAVGVKPNYGNRSGVCNSKALKQAGLTKAQIELSNSMKLLLRNHHNKGLV